MRDCSVFRAVLSKGLPVIATTLACIGLSDSAQSAVIHLDNGAKGSIVYIVGEIKAGDVNEFQQKLQIATLPTKVSIYSTGGDLVEAMLIGEIIRDRFVPVFAPSGHICTDFNSNSPTFATTSPESPDRSDRNPSPLAPAT